MKSRPIIPPNPIIDQWLEWLQSTAYPRRLAPSTVMAYCHHVTHFAGWLEETLSISLSPDVVTAYRLERYLAHLQEELKRKPTSQAQAIAALSTFGTWLVETHQCAEHPARRLVAQPEQESPPRALDRKAVLRLLDAAHHTGQPRDALIIELLAHTGLRASELVGIHIEHLEQGLRTVWLRIYGKGSKVRRIPVPKHVGVLIYQYLAIRAQREGQPPVAGPLLVGKRGAITRITINTTVARIVAHAHLPQEDQKGITPHTFRHTMATRIARKHDIVTAADLLGHASLNTTRRYVKVSANELEMIVNDIYKDVNH